MRYLRSTVAAIAVCAGMTSYAAVAQEAPEKERAEETPSETEAPAPTEIVVTASKTGAQSLQQVPLAIQAFDGENLKERNITTIGDLVANVPGAAEGFRQSNGSRFYNLRGAVTQNGDSPIGYYLDDTPFVVTNFGIAPPVRFIDMERVEVLRGPQGTLYGQGSAGGVFIFHTRDPSLDHVEYAVEGETSRTRGAGGWNYGGAAAVSVPIIQDRLGIRVSGGYSSNAGWADAYDGAFDGTPDRTDVNSSENSDIRVVALLKPADNVSVRAQYWNFKPQQDFTGFTASVKPPYFDDTAGQDSFSNGDFTLWSLTATAEFDAFSITSATSHLEGEFGINIPLSPAGSFSSQFYPKTFTQEVRINSEGFGPFHWLIGGAYQDGEGPQSNLLTLPGATINADNNTVTENWALFGEVSYDLFDGKLVPLVGLRTYQDDRSFVDSTETVPTKKSVQTWRANLSYLPTDNLTVFVSAATGFRPGIVQSKVQVQSLELAGVPASVALEPETTTNYELGVKWRSPDRSLTLGVNLYQLEYTDLQTSVTGGIDNVNGFANFGDATSKGLDIEANWNTPLEGLALGFVGNFNDSKYDEVNPVIAAAQPLLKAGDRLLNTIDQNYTASVNYNGEVARDVDGFANLSFSHNGDRIQTNGNTSPSYNTVNLTLGVRHGPWEVALLGSNLTDQRGPVFIGTEGPNSGVGLTPRTIGIRVRMTSF